MEATCGGCGRAAFRFLGQKLNPPCRHSVLVLDIHPSCDQPRPNFRPSALPLFKRFTLLFYTIRKYIPMLSKLRSVWGKHSRSTRVSSHSLHDWWSFALCIVLITCTILSIVNGTCSKSQGLSAMRELCIGGSLSIQSWLAIVGVEFSP